jgi:membrane fusion protein (multidrug efflux system)
VLGGWAWWCVAGRVTLYEVSANARLEIDRAAYAVQSPVAGNITSEALAVGREVKRGDVLLELDSNAERLQVAEERSRARAANLEIDSLDRQIAIEQQARQDEQRSARTAIDVARARSREAAAQADHAAAEAKRSAQLKQEKLIAERDYEAQQSDSRRQRAAAESAAAEVERLEDDLRAKSSERATRIQKLETDISRLRGQQAVTQSAVGRLEYEIERHKVRAATDGRIGEAAIVRTGGVVNGGERLGAILPEGRLLVVAQFPPAAALGHVRPGQKARVRLAGYPWIQYGALSATVARVSSEVRDGAVRVELTVEPGQKTSIPMQHGLPGSVEIAVERISPARLLMRLAGQQVTEPR